MQTNIVQSEQKLTPAIPFLLYLIFGVLIFFFGANTFRLFPTNHNEYYEWGLTLFLLLLVVIMQRMPRLQIYVKITVALFIASFANALNHSLGNFLGLLLHITGDDLRALAIDKLSQAIPIVVAIILLSLWSGDDLGALFLKRGNLRQGLKFGLISFAIWAVIFVVIVILQANAPSSQGLLASGVSVNTILVAIPWILIFIFANSFMEELWFRGVSLRKLTPLLGRMVSIIVTALVFGATHVGATYITPLEMIIFPIIVIALGLVNAHVMLKTDSIWGSVFFHAGYDLLVILPILVSG